MLVLGTWVSDLGDLTTLIIAFLIFVVLMVFRRQIAAIVERLTGVKLQRGDWIAEATMAEVTAQPDVSGGVEEADTDESEEHVSSTAKAPGVVLVADGAGADKVPALSDVDAVRREMFAAFDRGDVAAADRLYERLKSLIEDPSERKVDQARYLSLRYLRGRQPDALQQLDKLAEDDAVKPRVLAFKGFALKLSGEPSRAALEFRKAAEVATSKTFALETHVDEVESLCDAGDLPAAERRAIELLWAVEPTDRADLWVALADIYERDGRDEMRSLALQQALDARPGDPRLRFNVAYALGEASETTLGPAVLHHYETALEFDRDYRVAWNNAGVQLVQLKLPIEGMRYYREAADRGNTLAASNLAYTLLRAGFATEAETLLRDAAQQSSPHENVAQATAELAAARRAEHERKQAVLRTGQRQAEFLRGYGEAAILGPRPDLKGRWRSEDGPEVVIVVRDHRAIGEWTVQGGRHKFELSLTGAAGKGQFSRMRYSTWSAERRETGWQESDAAYMFLEAESGGNRLSMMRVGPETTSFEQLIRIEGA